MHDQNHPVRPFPLKPVTLALAIAYCSAYSPLSYAETEETQLGLIQVTAQRGSDTNTVVSAQRIEVEQAVSLQDLFKQTPEVSIGGGALPVAQKLYVHGIGERMLSVTIDGAAQPESAYHHAGQVMIEPELLKRVEIEAGTGAATAGPGALGGALRFTTKSASDLLRPDERIGAILKAGYLSASQGTKLGATVFGRVSDDIELLASQNDLGSSDYKDGNGRTVANTALDTQSSFIKLNAKKSGGHKFELAHEAYQDQGLRNKRTNMLEIDINPTQRQRMARQSTTFNYDYLPGDPLLALHLTTFLNENTVRLAMDTPQQERAGTKSHGFNLGNVSRLGEHKLSYGVNYRHDTGFADIASTALADEKSDVAGTYLQDDIALGTQWALGLGVRYDRYQYTDMVGQQFDSNGVSPSVNLAFMPNDQLTVRLSHARALRGVGVIEPYLKQFQTNDSHIDAEKANNTALGTEWQNGPWRLNASLFQQQIDNYIGYDDVRDNMGKVQTRGYSASAGYQAGQWSASLGTAYAKPNLNDVPLSSGDAFLLGNSSGRTWVTQLDYALPAQHIKLGWSGRFTEKLTYLPEGESSKPGYGIHDVYAQWLPTGKDNVTLTFTVKNLFDKAYVDQSSYGYHPRWASVAALPESGRDIRVSIAWRI
ncbi:MAG: TonB-dependent receptor [Pseudomonadota bacterium]